MDCENMVVKNSDKFIAFLLGLSIFEGVSMFFSVGSTVFTFSEILSPLIFVGLCILKLYKLGSFIKNIPLGFKIFFIMILLSIVSGIAAFASGDAVIRYLVGLIYLFIVFTMAANVFMLNHAKKWIINGLFVGFLANIVFSLICCLSFNKGTVITLSNMFDREGFFVPVHRFRSQGFFLEPSHFIRYVASVFLILISAQRIKSVFVKFALVIATIAVSLLSTSGSVVIMACGLVLYILIRKKSKIITPATLLTLFIVIIAICVFFTFNLGEQWNLGELTEGIFSGADIKDEGNVDRYESMVLSLGYLDDMLLGCGWNLVGSLFEQNHSGTVSAFSDILEMTLELGIFGIIFYIWSVMSLVLKLIRRKNNYSISLAVSLLIIFALQIGTDYAFNTCIMFVFGLAVAEIADGKKEAMNRLSAENN